MHFEHLLSRGFAMFAGALIALSASFAQALEPLDVFMKSATSRNFDARIQAATETQRDLEVDAALGRLVPAFTARGVYQYNQYDAVIALPMTTKEITIVPHNQLDATLQLDVPLLDLSSVYRRRQARALAAAADAQTDVVGLDVERSVARAYYSFIGASALEAAANESLKMAEENAAYVKVRRGAGVALELDLERAVAAVEKAKQDVADATLLRVTAARSLETLSGLTPSPVTDYPEDALAPEAPLESFYARATTPQERAQAAQLKAAEQSLRASRASMWPTLSATGQERFTNATGFAGRESSFVAQVVLAMRLDYTSWANAKVQKAAQSVEAIRAERTRRQVEDAIFDAYQRVSLGLVKSASARAQARAAEKARDLANERYRAGALTQLDVTQSMRDLFSAQAASIQADADLAYARVALRTASGRSFSTSSASSAK